MKAKRIVPPKKVRIKRPLKEGVDHFSEVEPLARAIGNMVLCLGKTREPRITVEAMMCALISVTWGCSKPGQGTKVLRVLGKRILAYAEERERQSRAG